MSEFAVVYHISSKLVHASSAPLQGFATAVAMATPFWRTCRERDGMRPAEFRPNRSIARRVMVFPIFSNMAAGRPFELKKNIFDHATVIVVLTCYCVPNFIEIGSRVRPPDAHNCRMFNAPLLGNGCCHGNRIMADMSGTWWDVTTQVASQ